MTANDLSRALQGIPRNSLRLVRVTIFQVAPFQIKTQDGTVLNALSVTGLTYTAGGKGVALMGEGSIPLVFPTN